MSTPRPVTPAPRWRSLRARLAAVGFAAIYVPALLVFGVVSLTEDEDVRVEDGVEVATDAAPSPSPWGRWTVVALAPAAAGLAWWWAGRAVRPLDRVRRVAEDIEATDLGRRIGLDRGPTEVVALAAAFDAMLDRLERAADAQRRLVEETSHELRTPLAVLATNADVLLASPAPTAEDYRQGLVRSRDAATRLQRAIEALLVEARGRSRTLDRRPVDLVTVVAGVVEDARTLAAGRAVDVALVAPEPAVGALDAPSVRRAVANLVDNAVRHTAPGTTVEVRVDASPDELAVTVTDQGPGVAEEDRERIFQRFWRGAGDRPGTGLGLPIAAQVAEAHGGRITVGPAGPPGPGARFRLTVPR